MGITIESWDSQLRNRKLYTCAAHIYYDIIYVFETFGSVPNLILSNYTYWNSYASNMFTIL